MGANGRYQIEEKIENDSGVALILKKKDFDIFVNKFKLPVFFTEYKDMTIYNGAIIGRSRRLEED